MKLGELVDNGLVEMGRGKVISKTDMANNKGEYPIYSSSVTANGLFGNYGFYMFDEEMITWSVDGGGNFFYRAKHKFSITNVSGYMKIKDNSIHCRYLFFVLNYMHQYQTFDYQIKAHPSVIKDIYTIPLPSLPEQEKITSCLSSLDTLYEAEQRYITTLQHYKRGLMQNMFPTIH